MFGIMDKDYIIKDGTVTFPEGMKYEQSSYMYWAGYGNFRNIEYERFPDAQLKDTMLKIIKTDSKYPKHEGFFRTILP